MNMSDLKTITARGRNIVVLPAEAEAIFEVSDTDLVREEIETKVSPIESQPRMTTIEDPRPLR
jgi:hypothetical protein